MVAQQSVVHPFEFFSGAIMGVHSVGSNRNECILNYTAQKKRKFSKIKKLKMDLK